jgi:hypothetical protein
MANILPISELSENPGRISKLCHAQNEPIFLTKDGYGDIVVMSISQYDELNSQAQAYRALLKKNGDQTESLDTLSSDSDNAEEKTGIEKLPLEDVRDILKMELKKQQMINGPSNKKRFP